MHLSMRVLSVAPREADAVGSLKFMQRGNGGRGNTSGRGEFNFIELYVFSQKHQVYEFAA